MVDAAADTICVAIVQLFTRQLTVGIMTWDRVMITGATCTAALEPCWLPFTGKGSSTGKGKGMGMGKCSSKG